MKNAVFYFTALLSFYTFAQEKELAIYFPQEQLIHPECINALDKNACLQDELEVNILTTLQKAIVEDAIEKDTLSATIN